jgi:hypothetical protein
MQTIRVRILAKDSGLYLPERTHKGQQKLSMTRRNKEGNGKFEAMRYFIYKTSRGSPENDRSRLASRTNGAVVRRDYQISARKPHDNDVITISQALLWVTKFIHDIGNSLTKRDKCLAGFFFFYVMERITNNTGEIELYCSAPTSRSKCLYAARSRE